MRVIFVEYDDNNYSFLWPNTYAEFLEELEVQFGYKPANNAMFFNVLEGKPIVACSESSFQGLVPECKVTDHVTIFYIGTKLSKTYSK